MVTSLRILESSLTLSFLLGFYIRSFFSTFPTYIVKFSFARKHRMAYARVLNSFRKEKKNVERRHASSLLLLFPFKETKPRSEERGVNVDGGSS